MLWIPYTPSGGHCESVVLFAFKVTDITAGADSLIEALKKERIPRIIHQTWKMNILPDIWEVVLKTCLNLMPD